MATLQEIVHYCNERTRLAAVRDFPGACNGLQVENDGKVTRIGAAVDAGLVPFEKAVAAGIDFLIVHHGLFWNPPQPFTGSVRQKLKVCLDGNLAVYSSHLPLDLHPEIGNNALLAAELGLNPTGGFVHYEGNPIGVLADCHLDRDNLRVRLEQLFPKVTAIEFGPERLERIGILTGSGQSAVSELLPNGARTLITGELKQQHFNQAQELGLNLYCCGHYATEVFGVQALAREVAEKFGLEWEFIETECPL